jgi:tetratricopeptide (TPR) repeat protein
MGRTSEAVNALISLLDMSPTDAEAWAELADLYLAQGLYLQAIYAQEEVLVLQPNAWNVRCFFLGLLHIFGFSCLANIGRLDTCPVRRIAPHGRENIRRV